MNSQQPGSTRAVRCPRHGLWYDPAVATLCSRCDAEAVPQGGRYVPWGLLLVLALVVGVAIGMWRRGPTVEVVQQAAAPEPAVPATQPGAPVASAQGPRSADVREIGYQLGGTTRRALVYAEAWPEPRPLVLAADPSGSHVFSMDRLLPAAREVRWIVATTPAVRNGNSREQNTLEISALRERVEQMFKVDRKRIVLEGWSGTGCGAYAQVLLEPSVYRGAIVENGHMGPWRDLGASAVPGTLVYLFTRSGDFNAPHTRKLRDTMQSAGYTVAYQELPGGHAPLMSDEMVHAFRWMDARL